MKARKLKRKYAYPFAVAICVVSALSTPAMAQTSASHASVFDDLGNTYRCQQSSGVTAGGSASTCPATAVVNGTASATTASNNSTRTVSAAAAVSATTVQEEAVAQAYSDQTSTIQLTGTPNAGDHLVFHFLTPVAQGAANIPDFGGAGTWALSLSVGGSATATQEIRTYYGDGSVGTTYGSNTHATAGGVDFMVPFSAFGNTSALNYIFEAYAQASNASGTSNASLLASLFGVDAVDAQGNHLGSVSFGTNGTGTLELATTTTPEPSSMALLASGLVVLAPIVRRRRV